VESFFREVPVDVVCGANPIYKQVCSYTTGQAEVVQVTYDPAEAT
jgi:peptide methionine sulfoxide reductase MsrA